MKRFAITAMFAVAALVTGVSAASLELQAQEPEKPAPAPKPEEPKGGEKKPDAPAPKDGEKKPDAPAPKEGEKKPEAPAAKEGEAKPAEKEYKDEYTDSESLMKALRRQKLQGARSVRDKNADQVKDQADRIRYFASVMVATDKKPHAKNQDYKDWAAQLEKQGRELRDLAAAKTPDWEKIAAKRDEALKTCDSCHEKYEEKEKK